MIDRAYRSGYEAAFRELLAQAAPGTYDEMALPSYTHGNRLMAWLFWRRIDKALELAVPLAGHQVLDFGCGGGVIFKALHAQGCRIIGVDPEAHGLAIEMSRRMAVPTRIVERLDQVHGHRFDRVFALDVLEHVDDLEGCIRQLATTLAVGGRIVVSGPTENVWYRLGRRLAGFSGHYHVRSVHDIEAGFLRCGLRCIATRTLRLPFALFRLTSWQASR